MGQIHKIGEEYYIEFTARGLLYQQKAGKYPKKAEELLRSIEEKIANGEMQISAREIDLDIFYNEFSRLAKSQYHPASVRRLLAAIEHFGKFIREQKPDISKLSHITPRVIEDYKTFGIKIRQSRQGKFNPGIVNLTLLLLREMFEYGIKLGFINDNPTLHVKLLDVKRSVFYPLTDDKVSMLLNTIKKPYRDVCVLMRYAGLRSNEAIDLTWQQVDFNRNVIFIKLREVPILAQAVEVFKDNFRRVVDQKARVLKCHGENWVEYTKLIGVFQQACISAKIPEISLGNLRHAFIKDLLMRRVSILAIAKMLGIKDAAKLMVFSAFIPITHKDIFPKHKNYVA